MYKDKRIVLHILEPEPEGEIGGADTHVLNLCIAQKKYSVFFPVVMINQNNDFYNKLQNNGITCINLCDLKRKKKDVVKRLRDLPIWSNLELIHSHQYDANYITVLLKIIYRDNWMKIPTIMTCHGWVEISLQNKIKTFFDFYTYKYADGIITTCERDVKRLLARKNAKDKEIITIQNGVKVVTVSNVNKNELKMKYNLPLNKIIIAAVGRLASEKRFDVFLHNCKIIYQKRKDVHFVIVGSGSKENDLKKIAANLGLKQVVTFTGLVEDMQEMYSCIDILIISSDTEKSSRVMLEGMSFKIPVIATSVGEIPNIIRNWENGIIVQRRDYEEMSSCALRLLDENNLCYTLGENALKTVCDFYTIENMQKRIEAFYLRILKNRK